MADRQQDAEARRKQAGEEAQSNAESGASGSMINSEPYSGGGEDGDACTMSDGRAGVVRESPTGKTCEVEADGDGSSTE